MGTRWREMLMDYGQVLGDKSSRSSNSAFFTVDGDLDEKRNEELQLRRVLEVHFRPLFQRFVYGGEKIACHDLRRILRDPEYRNHLPPDKVYELSDLADFNMGRAVKYEEFVRIVLGRQDDASSFGSQNDLSGNNKYLGRLAEFLGVICRNTTQQVMINDRLTKYKCLPPPVFMLAITLTQIIVFIVYSQEDGVVTDPLKDVPPGNKAMYLPNRRREAWRFVTYCFMHQGYIDLIFNIIIQLVLGIPLEIIFSTWRMVVVYFCGVIVGSLGHSVCDHSAGLAGAAGGAYAIMFAHAVGLFLNWKHLNDDMTESKWKRVVCSLTLRFTFMLVIFIPQVALAVYRRWFYDVNEKIGIAAHIGGLITGFVLGQAFLMDIKRQPWKDPGGFCDLFLLMVFVGFAVIFNIVYEGYPAEDYS